MNFSEKLIEIFKQDLCKDQREIALLNDVYKNSISGKIMRKYNTSVEEYNNEVNVINYLLKEGILGIPRVLGHGFENNIPYIDIEYFDGIRVFNVLAYLREIEKKMPDLKKDIVFIKETLRKKCLERQKSIQNVLIKWANDCGKTDVYPQKKIRNIIEMLSKVMQLEDINFEKLSIELDGIISDFNRIAKIPFRDSTTKNMVIYYPKLYLGNFIDENTDVLSADLKRKDFFIKMIKDGTYKEILNAPIIDFDFSSCEHLTSIYDDPIGYNCHEIMWSGTLDVEELIWNGEKSINFGKDIALSFIIRFLRFGGRKMCYHIFHPHAYKYRFKYDNENFYFNNLNKIIIHYWPECEKCIPEFMNFINKVVLFDKSKIIDNIDEFELEYPSCNRKFYLDLFPY